MKCLFSLSVLLVSFAVSGCSSDKSSGLSLPEVADIVSEAKPAALGSASGLMVRQARSTLSVSLLSDCSYGSTTDIFTCIKNNVLDETPDGAGSQVEQLFHWLGNLDTAMGSLETRFSENTPDCTTADPVSVMLELPLSLSATVQLQCREQDDVSNRSFGVDADGNTYLIHFSNPDATSAEDIATIAIVSADGNQADAWVFINGTNSPFSPTIQRISGNKKTGSFSYESRGVINAGNSFKDLLLIGNSTYLSGSGAEDSGSSFTSFCVNSATGEDLSGGECSTAAFPTTDLTGDGSVALSISDSVAATAAISALVETEMPSVSTVE